MKMTNFYIDKNLPSSIKVSNRNRYLIEGWIFGTSRLKYLAVSIDGKEFPSADFEKLRRDVYGVYKDQDHEKLSLFSGFCIPVIFQPVKSPQSFEVFLKADFKDRTSLYESIGTIELAPPEQENPSIIIPTFIDQTRMISICMATYNPPADLFNSQITSIINQDYRDWICLITDDSQDEETRARIQRTVECDPRFFYFRNSQRLGFYHNFEHGLSLIPKQSKYVAFCDQDDEWFPNKLSKTVSRFTGDIQLVYCDMNIKKSTGEIISNTYWSHRRNYFCSKNLDLLAIANTVTGTASVFRAELVKKILPFPPLDGAIYHDNWVAIIAAASGGIAYIDEPLFNYIQSGENVLGHFDFSYRPIIQYLRILFSSVNFAVTSNGNLINRTISRLVSAFRSLAWVFIHIYYFYEYNSKNTITVIEIASLRDIDQMWNKILRRPLSIKGLLLTTIKVYLNKETLDNLELSLLLSKCANLAVKSVIIPIRKPLLFIAHRLKSNVT
jgi:glycosyltransferase involved in cell wall biosynthesis